MINMRDGYVCICKVDVGDMTPLRITKLHASVGGERLFEVSI
jgi:hypothetical protein